MEGLSNYCNIECFERGFAVTFVDIHGCSPDDQVLAAADRHVWDYTNVVLLRYLRSNAVRLKSLADAQATEVTLYFSLHDVPYMNDTALCFSIEER